jgi:hypothetical protein
MVDERIVRRSASIAGDENATDARMLSRYLSFNIFDCLSVLGVGWEYFKLLLSQNKRILED